MYKESRWSHNWLIFRLTNHLIAQRLTGICGVVLDLGCGTRPFEKDILKYATQYIGLDWSKSLHGIHADVIADLNSPLPIKDKSVDHILTMEVVEHLAEPGIMLREALRILRPRGTLCLSVPFQWWIHEEPWDYQRFTRHGLDYQLRKAGFVEIDIRPKTGFWSMWVLKFNYQTARLIRGPQILRLMVRAALIPIWWVDQTIAPLLDKVLPEDRETAGYVVMARKP